MSLKVGDDSIDEFFLRLDNWVQSTKIVDPAFDDLDMESIINMSLDDLGSKSNTDLIKYAYLIYGYVDHLQIIYNKEKCVLEFAEESIWHIISLNYDSYGSDFKKWQAKYNAAVRENPLASKLNVLKNNARARISCMEHRIEHVKKKADILLELSRRY